MKRYLSFLALLLRAACAAEAPPTAVLSSVFINENAPYPECHASTIAETAPGRFVAAWFGGTKERDPDVCIYVSRFTDGCWSPGAAVADGVQPDGSRLPTWNPVLFQTPQGGPLVLFFRTGPNPSAWWGMVMRSTNGGKTWSKPMRLPDGILGPIKNKPVVLSDGAWLSPSSIEGSDDGWLVHFELSRDAGRTWVKTDPVSKGGTWFDAIQPSILIFRDGRLEALCRTKQGMIAMTWSKDGGRTWSALTATELPNPNSGIDAVTLADGRQLLVYNHSGNRSDETKGNRWPLNVAVSTDGFVWRRVLTLESAPCAAGYAYPAVIQAVDGTVHLTYTWDRKRIKHVVLDPAKL